MEELNNPGRITVINPNSSQAVTQSIDKALAVSYTHLTLPTKA